MGAHGAPVSCVPLPMPSLVGPAVPRWPTPSARMVPVTRSRPSPPAYEQGMSISHAPLCIPHAPICWPHRSRNNPALERTRSKTTALAPKRPGSRRRRWGCSSRTITALRTTR